MALFAECHLLDLELVICGAILAEAWRDSVASLESLCLSSRCLSSSKLFSRGFEHFFCSLPSIEAYLVLISELYLGATWNVLVM